MNVTNHERATLILRINLQYGQAVLQTHLNEFVKPSAMHRDFSLELEIWFLFLAQWLPWITISSPRKRAWIRDAPGKIRTFPSWTMCVSAQIEDSARTCLKLSDANTSCNRLTIRFA
jgi:hypothetical protein